MSEYRKIPQVVKAAKIVSVDGTEATFDVGDGDAGWLQDALERAIGDEGGVWVLNDGIRIGTLEGVMRANAGDYLVRGIEGEIYPVKQSIFEKSYEPLDKI